jgi:pyruvate-ferredoxin/flavodoxin oxidoreductase
MLFPDEAKNLHTQLEAEFADRYTVLKRMADTEYEAAEPSGELAAVDGDSDACTLAGTAEHAGRAGADDACDDGRAGT